MKGRILVVDDEKDICDILQFNLENEGYIVDVAHSGEDALEMITDIHGVIILDVMMGGISGFKVAEKLRKSGNFVPIIFLTAKNTENDMLTGFSLGGDDYIAKPFSVKEVLVRVKALLKRSALTKMTPAEPIPTDWSYKGLNIDLQGNRVTIDGNEVSLTKKEFEILSLLARTSPNLLTRTEILNSVWGENEFVLDRTVDVHITRLRKKLGDYAGIIVNRSGFGYYLNIDAKDED
ncbi:DNA-binding response regulator [Proteiniphilum saccharofermentans]|uniref:DNA-binding response regulator n=1 Tax=Proteiniphilum saccharofermentans TaxID=1642647 RepID=A0A1R3T9Y3_9BACT|nr:response regulator transcription factor [Proteiniphilum saccharofermentans]SCD20404.1 DNA-binding response regulator [Proteiniphilum saccharofermentans]SFL60053.1 DNA-binding response regulator, OmpR family, contains REC and winged-helix (wHTH) domain [Porphyromonadaceae bacterium KH3CP3RA]